MSLLSSAAARGVLARCAGEDESESPHFCTTRGENYIGAMDLELELHASTDDRLFITTQLHDELAHKENDKVCIYL